MIHFFCSSVGLHFGAIHFSLKESKADDFSQGELKLCHPLLPWCYMTHDMERHIDADESESLFGTPVSFQFRSPTFSGLPPGLKAFVLLPQTVCFFWERCVCVCFPKVNHQQRARFHGDPQVEGGVL